MKLSVSMIVKNEEHFLPRCLESVKDADEIIILDTGSTDRTGEIARSFPNVMYLANDYVWNDNFAEARNRADSYCTGDWILVIDADETLEAGGIQKIRTLLEDMKHDVLSFRIEDAHNGNNHQQPRVYRRRKDLFWKGAIHNYLSVPGQTHVPVTIYARYSPNHKTDPDRALRILLREVEKNKSAVREVYYLAREYLYRKDWINSFYWYQLYIMRSKWAPEKADAFLCSSKCLWFLHRGEDARQMCLRAIYINPNFKEALLWLAHISGPKAKERWTAFAETATNEGVLFVRNAPITGG